VSTKSPSKVTYEPAREGDGYARINKDPMTLPPSLRCCPLGKWHNPDGQHFTLDIDPEAARDEPDHWYKRSITAGELVEPKKGSKKKGVGVKEVDTPIARLAALGPAVLGEMCAARGLAARVREQPPAMAKRLVAAGVTEAPKPPAPAPAPQPAAEKGKAPAPTPPTLTEEERLTALGLEKLQVLARAAGIDPGRKQAPALAKALAALGVTTADETKPDAAPGDKDGVTND